MNGKKIGKRNIFVILCALCLNNACAINDLKMRSAVRWKDYYRVFDYLVFNV